jgi:ABC-2 type transport system ATP-binding protein
MNAVEIEQVTKSFGDIRAVDELSLRVPGGSIYGFIGPNGSGKTTTLRMIMNIFYPDRGAIRVLGRESVGACWEDVGYLPEERGLYKKMKVGEVLRFYGGLKSGRSVGPEVDEWLERLELADRARETVETLSKGMSQKVQFIAAVVPRPELLILDEPFTGLDPVNAEVIRQAILELRGEGTTVVLSTHDMAVAESLCDSIFMIFRGRKVLDGTLDSIQEAYGRDTLRVRCDGGAAALGALPGAEKVHDLGQLQEIRMAAGADAQEILRTALSRTALHSFEVVSPSLRDIFVRIAGPEAEEGPDA